MSDHIWYFLFTQAVIWCYVKPSFYTCLILFCGKISVDNISNVHGHSYISCSGSNIFSVEIWSFFGCRNLYGKLHFLGSYFVCKKPILQHFFQGSKIRSWFYDFMVYRLDNFGHTLLILFQDLWKILHVKLASLMSWKSVGLLKSDTPTFTWIGPLRNFDLSGTPVSTLTLENVRVCRVCLNKNWTSREHVVKRKLAFIVFLCRRFTVLVLVLRHVRCRSSCNVLPLRMQVCPKTSG